MNKSKALRIGGFTLAVGVTASLVGFAAHGTGAYFSGASNGNIAASLGHVTVTSSPSTLQFKNSLPGTYTTDQVTYKATGDAAEDIYLAFDTYPGDYTVNGYGTDQGPYPTYENALGRYGHLKVTGPSGTFESNNLSTDSSQQGKGLPNDGRGTVSGDPTADCYENPTTGLGGSSAVATRAADPTNPGHGAVSYLNSCPAPAFILLSKGLKSTDGVQSASIEFGWTQVMDANAQQGQVLPNIPFRIVAEQAGVLPSNPNTTNGR